MKSVPTWIQEIFEGSTLVCASLTGRRQADAESARKIDIKPALIRGEMRFQFAFFHGSKVTHRNLTAQEAQSQILSLLENSYRQAVFHTMQADLHVHLAKNGELALSTRPPSKLTLELSHDRPKNHLLPEGKPVDFLIRLGVMTDAGKVIAARYDKFRQINRFLEIVADAVAHLDKPGPLSILDFGSGKSYLTFALYYYLKVMQGREVRIIGLDRKQDVIAHCNNIAQDLRYTALTFQVGDIRDFDVDAPVDMVVSLHACDTATDDALAKAVAWNAKVILAVPCCQHELFRQIRNDSMRPLLKHGILKERLTALVTDALRAEMLELAGYSVQVLEFIEMEHTPKNLLIRAIRRDSPANRTELIQEYQTFRDFWHLTPCIESLFPSTGNSTASETSDATVVQ